MLKGIFLAFFISSINLIFAQNGSIRTYYSSGEVESNQSFIKDVMEGTSYWYFRNGNIKTQKEYSNGKLNGAVKNFYSNGLLMDEFNYLDGMLHGVAKSYYENGGLKEVYTYNYGELKDYKIIEYDSNYIAPLTLYDAGKKKNKKNENDFICAVEICPEPVGGIKEIENNIVYPFLARQYRLEGSVLLTATVSKRGIVENIRINQGLGLGCDEAAIQAVRSTKFIPGRNNGEEVETDVTFKLNFRIKEAGDKLSVPKLSNESLVNSQISDSSNSYDKGTEFISCDLEICPKPIGGIMGLLSNLRYPPQARRKGIEGEVVVQAKVNEVGFIISAEVIKGIGYGCDEAAKSVIIKTQFQPGMVNGKETESVIEITVPFILTPKE